VLYLIAAVVLVVKPTGLFGSAWWPWPPSRGEGQATQGRSLSTLAPLRALRARAWARRAVGESVKSSSSWAQTDIDAIGLVTRKSSRSPDHNSDSNTIGKHLQVFVRDNNVEQALRALKKKMQPPEGVFRELKRRKAYEKPSERRTREKEEAIRRVRKAARKQAQRDGLIPIPKRREDARRSIAQRRSFWDFCSDSLDGFNRFMRVCQLYEFRDRCNGL
jgi:small subunit ribosomal protein S21